MELWPNLCPRDLSTPERVLMGNVVRRPCCALLVTWAADLRGFLQTALVLSSAAARRTITAGRLEEGTKTHLKNGANGVRTSLTCSRWVTQDSRRRRVQMQGFVFKLYFFFSISTQPSKLHVLKFRMFYYSLL